MTYDPFDADADGVMTPDGVGTPTTPVEQATIGKHGIRAGGGDLASVISGLISNGVTDIRINEPSDGSAWTWGSDLVVDLAADGGVTIDVAQQCVIEYGGTGWMIKTDNSWGGVTGEDSQLHIKGGVWRATDNPTGWLQLNDCYGSFINPTKVAFDESTNDGFGIQVRNVDSYSESSFISGKIRADKCLDFRPAAITGGTGTESFHDTKLDHVHLNGNEWCMRTGGNFQYVTAVNPVFQPNENGATGLILDAPRHDGTVFLGAKFESPPSPGGITALDSGPNNDNFYTPLFLGTRESNFGIDTQVGDSGLNVPEVRGYGSGLYLGRFGRDDVEIKGKDISNVASISMNSPISLNDFNSVIESTTGLLIFQCNNNGVWKADKDGIINSVYKTQNLSGETASNTGDARLDDGTNTTHGDPDLCVWNGTAWRQVGTTNTFT